MDEHIIAAYKPNRYAALKACKQEITRPLFKLSITASTRQKGTIMEKQLNTSEAPFLIDLVFKPVEPGLKLRPEEIQLLTAYIGEILKELESIDQQPSTTLGD